MKVSQKKDIRLGLRMSQEDMEWLDLCCKVMGYETRAAMVRALIRMVVGPVKTEAIKRGVSIDEMLNKVDTHFVQQ